MISLQIQSIIYNNQKESLLKAIKGIKQAVVIYKKLCKDIKVTLIYGDASPKMVLNEDDIKYFQENIGSDITFKYEFFNNNTGTSYGHNLLANKVESDYILVMNPDVILEPRCLERLFNALVNKPKAQMVEARQVPIEHPKSYNNETGETEWATTACALFTTKIFKELNGFDANSFFMYCDDLDFSWRIRLAGYKVYYVPSALVFHSKKLSASGEWKPTKAEIYYSAEAAMILSYKWSRSDISERLCSMFLKSHNKDERKAAEEYLKRKHNSSLPKQIDGDHKIGKFLNDNYGDVRFKFA